VIDLKKIQRSELYFDESISLLEDYDFLLRLCLKYDFDFEALGTFVAEYRIRKDNSNTIPYGPDAPALAVDAHKAATELIRQRKECGYYAAESDRIFDLAAKVHDLKEQNKRLAYALSQMEQQQQEERSRLLNSMVRGIYLGFARFPKLESALSRWARVIKDRRSSWEFSE
jgi:hypothetical protein